MSNIAVDTLTKKLDQLFEEKRAVNEQLDSEIASIVEALTALGQKPDNGVPKSGENYDDENPGYIKNTEDGI